MLLSRFALRGLLVVCKSSTKPVAARCVLRTSLGCDSLFRNSIEVGRRSISELLKLEAEAELNRSGVIRLATDHAERCGIPGPVILDQISSDSDLHAVTNNRSLSHRQMFIKLH